MVRVGKDFVVGVGGISGGERRFQFGICGKFQWENFRIGFWSFGVKLFYQQYRIIGFLKNIFWCVIEFWQIECLIMKY